MKWLLLTLAAATLVACSKPKGPPLEITGLEIFAPLPGSNTGVAYFNLRNNTDSIVAVQRVESPDFQRVELHESVLTDGVYRMQSLDALAVEPGRTETLREGGKHLMLMTPRAGLEIGQSVTLLVHYDSDGEVVLRATLQSRVKFDDE